MSLRFLNGIIIWSNLPEGDEGHIGGLQTGYLANEEDPETAALVSSYLRRVSPAAVQRKHCLVLVPGIELSPEYAREALCQ